MNVEKYVNLQLSEITKDNKEEIADFKRLASVLSEDTLLKLVNKLIYLRVFLYGGLYTSSLSILAKEDPRCRHLVISHFLESIKKNWNSDVYGLLREIPKFKEFLSKNEIDEVLEFVTLKMCHSDFLVRSSAMRCLQDLMPIAEWLPNLIKNVMGNLFHEREDVRALACQTLVKLFEN